MMGWEPVPLAAALSEPLLPNFIPWTGYVYWASLECVGAFETQQADVYCLPRSEFGLRGYASLLLVTWGNARAGALFVSRLSIRHHCSWWDRADAPAGLAMAIRELWERA